VASGPTRPRSPDEFGATGTQVQDDGYAAVFWTAFRRSSNPMVLTDLDRRIVAVNEAATRVSERPVEALVGRPFADLLDDPAEALDDDTWRERVVAGESYGHRRIRRPDGSTVVVDFAMRAARVDGRVLVLGVGLHIAPEHPAAADLDLLLTQPPGVIALSPSADVRIWIVLDGCALAAREAALRLSTGPLPRGVTRIPVH